MEVFEERIKEMLARNSKGYRGTNCWNTTRKLFEGSLTPFRWEDGYVMEQWLDDNTMLIGKHELQKYDIISFWSYSFFSDDRIEHTAVWLGDGKVFHKNGTYPYEITTLREAGIFYTGCRRKYHRFMVKGGEDNA